MRALCPPFSPKVLRAGVEKGLIVRSDLEPGEHSSLTRMQAPECRHPVSNASVLCAPQKQTMHSHDADNRLAIEGSKIDTLMRFVSTLQTQNQTILRLLDRLEEEKAGYSQREDGSY